MNKSEQVFKITRAPEAKCLDENRLTRLIQHDRPDSEWAVRELSCSAPTPSNKADPKTTFSREEIEKYLSEMAFTDAENVLSGKNNALYDAIQNLPNIQEYLTPEPEEKHDSETTGGMI